MLTFEQAKEVFAESVYALMLSHWMKLGCPAQFKFGGYVITED